MRSDVLQISALVAQAGELPAVKALMMALFFGGVAVFSLFGLLASEAELRQLAGVIGTEDPRVARVVCGLSLVVGTLATVVSVAALFGANS